MKKLTVTLQLPELLKTFDWIQAVLHRGEPCFHIEGKDICGRAKPWVGHGVMHKFVSLSDAVREYGATCRAAAIDAQIDIQLNIKS